MRTIKILTALLIGILSLNGCIREDLSDCQPELSTGIVLRYRYDLNMSYKDMFGEKVNLLSAYIFDESGVLCKKVSQTEKPGQNWEQKVILEPGKYTVLTWAGGEYSDEMFINAHTNESIDTPFKEGVTIGKTTLDELRIFLRQAPLSEDKDKATPDNLAFSDLYHGIVKQVEVKPLEITEVVTRLINNTKTIQLKITGIELLRCVNMKPSDFDVQLSSRNGHYRFDNLIGEYAREMIYTPHSSYVNDVEYGAQIKTLRLIPENEVWNTPVLLNILFKPAKNMPICQNLDIVKVILSGKIDERDALGNLILDEDGKPVKVFATREYLDRQDTFELELIIEEGPDKELIVTIKIENWHVTDIYPIPRV